MIFFSSALVSGCGAAPPAEPATVEARPPEPPAPGMPPPAEREQHIADAYAELALAEGALDRALEPVTPSPVPRTEPTARPPGQGATPAPPSGGVAPPADASAPEPGCQTACLALQSMRRSARYVCKLAGVGDDRCLGATDRVRRAEAKVASASCACPEGDG